MIRVLCPDALLRACGLGESTYLPPEILALQKEIEGETRAAELRSTVTGETDEVAVRRIVEMKCRLDELYLDWAEGKLK